MGKGNIVYHNLRMNLDNEQHRRVHSVLAELNTDVHKSVNQFLIDAADSYISRLAGNELTKESEQTGECQARGTGTDTQGNQGRAAKRSHCYAGDSSRRRKSHSDTADCTWKGSGRADGQRN